eukprot:1164241_1
MASAPIFVDPSNVTEYKLHIAIDFGTDGLGLAYAIGDEVYIHNKWNSARYADVVKPKTIILLDKQGDVECFGQEAKEMFSDIIRIKDRKQNVLHTVLKKK